MREYKWEIWDRVFFCPGKKRPGPFLPTKEKNMFDGYNDIIEYISKQGEKDMFGYANSKPVTKYVRYVGGKSVEINEEEENSLMALGRTLRVNIGMDVVIYTRNNPGAYSSESEDYLASWCKILTEMKEKQLKDLSLQVLSDNSRNILIKKMNKLSGDDEMVRLYTKLSRREMEFNTYKNEAREEVLAKINEKLESLKNIPTFAEISESLRSQITLFFTALENKAKEEREIQIPFQIIPFL